MVLDDSNFTGSTAKGGYMDYLTLPSAPLYVAGPSPESSIIVQPWNLSSSPPLGVGEFDINSAAPVGTIIVGIIQVDYSEYFDPGSFVSDSSFSASAQVDVTPEPSSLLTLGSVLLFPSCVSWWRGIRRS